jgi:alkylation response protein AidB-like acyl-CoA dehydrogenase
MTPELTAASVRRRLRTMLAIGELDLALPAAGQTPARHRALFEFGRTDLSLARLAEAHTDAVAILREAGLTPQPRALYGVWASDGPQSQLVATRVGNNLRLQGAKQFCSGARLVDVALVTAHLGTRVYLLQVPLATRGTVVQKSAWATPAFAATDTANVVFRNVRLSTRALIGGGNWYLERVGFWHGALGPAACWAGGAAGLVDAARSLHHRSAHTRAQIGALEAARWSLVAQLDQAGQEIDQARSNHDEARKRALIVRHLIERTCIEVVDRFGRATGPALLAFESAIARRHAELLLYIRQCHAERDLEAIATSTP